MYLHIATVVLLAVAAVVEWLAGMPWVTTLLLIAAAGTSLAALWQHRRLSAELGKLAGNFAKSRNHAANLDRQLALDSPLLKAAEQNLNTFLGELQSGVGQVRSANIRIAAATASIGFQLKRVVAISATQRE